MYQLHQEQPREQLVLAQVGVLPLGRGVRRGPRLGQGRPNAAPIDSLLHPLLGSIFLIETGSRMFFDRYIIVIVYIYANAGDLCLGGDRAKFLNLLSTKEPILLTAERIPDEIYWQRCCKEILPTCDTANHGGSFKRLFLEKHLQSCIEKYVPLQTDMYDVKDLLGTFEPYIKRLEITELLPPTLLLVKIWSLKH